MKLLCYNSLFFILLQSACSIDGIIYCAFEDCRQSTKISINQECLNTVNKRLNDSLGFTVKEPAMYKSQDYEHFIYSHSIESQDSFYWSDSFPNGVYIFLNDNCEIKKVASPIMNHFSRRGI